MKELAGNTTQWLLIGNYEDLESINIQLQLNCWRSAFIFGFIWSDILRTVGRKTIALEHGYLLLCIVDQLVFLCEFYYHSPICWRHWERSAPSYLVDLPVIILVVIPRGLTWTFHFQYMESVQTVRVGNHTLRPKEALAPPGKCQTIFEPNYILLLTNVFTLRL